MTPDTALAARLADPCPICGAVMEPYGDHFTHPVDDCVLAQMIIFDDAVDDWNRRPAMQSAVAKAVEAEREACAAISENQDQGWHDGISAEYHPYSKDELVTRIAAAIRARKGDAL